MGGLVALVLDAFAVALHSRRYVARHDFRRSRHGAHTTERAVCRSDCGRVHRGVFASWIGSARFGVGAFGHSSGERVGDFGDYRFLENLGSRRGFDRNCHRRNGASSKRAAFCVFVARAFANVGARAARAAFVGARHRGVWLSGATHNGNDCGAWPHGSVAMAMATIVNRVLTEWICNDGKRAGKVFISC